MVEQQLRSLCRRNSLFNMPRDAALTRQRPCVAGIRGDGKRALWHQLRILEDALRLRERLLPAFYRLRAAGEHGALCRYRATLAAYAYLPLTGRRGRRNGSY